MGGVHSHSRKGPRFDPVRRQLVFGLSLLPAAGLVLGARSAWSLDNEVSIVESGGQRIIDSNGIPNHPTGAFPNAHNPNTIAAQDLEFRMPLAPQRAGRFTRGQGWRVGVAVNGVPFDPFTAEFWNNDRDWNYDAVSGFLDLGLDENDAHVQPGGLYHYHGWPLGLVRTWSPSVHSPIVGWAADGFPIYAAYGYADGRGPGGGTRPMTSGWRVKSGSRPGGPGGSYDGRFFQDWEWMPGLGDLDQANGRDCVTPDFPDGTYAYFLSLEWPIVPRYLAGTPDASFRIGPPQGGRPGGRPGGGPPGGGPPPFGGRPFPRG